MIKSRVGFLFDISNAWIYPYFLRFIWAESIRTRYELVEIHDAGQAVGFDVLFILGYTKLLPPAILEKNTINLVVHESELPKGRGFSPVQWQVLNGERQIPVCLIEAVREVDAGRIFGTAVMDLQGHELLDEIRAIQARVTFELISTFLGQFPNVSSRAQDGTPSYYRRRIEEDDELDINKPLSELFDQLRIASNEDYPAWFKARGFRYHLKICKADNNE